MATHSDKHPRLTGRFSKEFPGPLVSSGTVRGTFMTMLERFDLDAVRGFWRNFPLTVQGKAMDEAEGYRYLWQEQGPVHLHHLDELNLLLNDFLFDRGLSHFDFYDEVHFRFKKGGMWSAQESLAWVKNLLPKLYTEADPKFILLRLVCEWAMRAVPGAVCELHSLSEKDNWVSTIYSFAPDGTFRNRCPFVFSRSTIHGLRIFPKFLGLTPFEETSLVADCLHPDDILRNANWEISDGKFLIDGRPYGQVVSFRQWALPLDLKFSGTPAPDREVILMESDFLCPVRGIKLLIRGCVYDAPLFLARLGFPRRSPSDGGGVNRDFLANILEAFSLKETPEWLVLDGRFRELLGRAEAKLVFEFRVSSQLMLLNDQTLISGVPAMILRKILVQWLKGQTRFDFRAFKHDPEIFPDPKRANFETRWLRLKEKLQAEVPDLKVEKSGKGEFAISAACPVELRVLA